MRLYLVSPIPYSFLHQRPQKLADRMRSLGFKVTYIEPCGLREFLSGRRKGLWRNVLSSFWYHLLAVLALIFPAYQRKPLPDGGSRKPLPDFEIIAMPLIIPNNRVSSIFLEKLNASVFRQVLRHRVFKQMVPGETTVALVENPFYGRVIRKGDFDRLFYDCLDEISLYSGRSPASRFLVYERMLVENADGLFVTAAALEEHLRSLGIPRPMIRIPNGVDAKWFEERAKEKSPEDLMNISGPIVGYVGVIFDWMDYELIGIAATELRDVSFVFVGPVDYESRIAALRSLPNVYWLGRKEYEDVPGYIQRFDACIIPFRVGKISRTTNPVKVFEYFALGKPVVSTRLTELEQFGGKNLLQIADTPEEFVAALKNQLEEHDPKAQEARREVARSHSWDVHAATMAKAFGVSPGAPA